jgi:5-methylcytosine-specific restriction endonuclease McrA
MDFVLSPSAVALWAAQEGRCFYCDCCMCRECDRPDSATRDHFFPKCLGRPLRGNSVFACKACNQRKGHRVPLPHEVRKFRALYEKAGVRVPMFGVTTELCA